LPHLEFSFIDAVIVWSNVKLVRLRPRMEPDGSLKRLPLVAFDAGAIEDVDAITEARSTFLCLLEECSALCRLI
jgi:hypothetical protein